MFSKHAQGKAKIDTAISAFQNADVLLGEGIDHMNTSITEHMEKIADSQAHIEECNGHIARGQRIRERIKKIIE